MKFRRHNKGLPLVSIVVTVLNEAKHISQTIESLLNLDYPNYEIIIVDDGSEDGTVDIIKRYPGIELIESSGGNISKGRNIGIKHAKGEIVAITDGDMVVERGWLRNLAQHYADEKIGGVGGLTRSYPRGTIFQKTISILPQPGCRCRGEKITSTNHSLIASGNASYRRQVLEEIGGFDEDLMVGEDLELNMRILKSGRLLKFTPKAVAYHFPRETVIDYCRQHYNYGVGLALAHKKDIDILKLRLRGIIPFFVTSFFLIVFASSLFYPPLFAMPKLFLAAYFLLVMCYVAALNMSNKAQRPMPILCGLAASIIYGVRVLVFGAGYIMGLLARGKRRRIHKKRGGRDIEIH